MKYIWERKNWFDFKYDNTVLLKPLSELRVLQGKLLGRLASLDIKLETEAQGAILVEEAVRTAEIEGQKLNRDEVRSSVAVKLGLPYGVGSHNRNIDGLVDVLLDAVRFHDKPLTLERLNGWHAALFPTGYSGLRKIKTGKPRGNEPMQIVSGPIGKEKVHFEALPRDRLDEEMRLFLKWWNSSQGSVDGILRAAVAHLRFLTIHPYEDGNGRIARAITDMALAQDEKMKVRFYSVSSEIMRSRNEYYNILEGVQRCRIDPTEWFLWFIKCITTSIEDSRDIIANVFMKVDFWNQHAQDELNDRQKKIINHILELGPGNFTGGLTTRKYVSITKASRATAFREISDMLDKKILHQLSGKGRSVHYDLVWPQVGK
ncbi:MAG: cell filamentation protein Fic [Omnitrophica bacterium RIFCSPLOWO2_02_FULL_45_16]|nr:MAG: cell filamentation protein Fic [Omnitrophica bacterium RIFCSPHIGHO2_02_FULL_46_20]OGX00522.1 MAG: cell filamentation protein Fic [Omnitrophica bacterium RIFCSPLOWO2_02_FULL_45_16]